MGAAEIVCLSADMKRQLTRRGGYHPPVRSGWDFMAGGVTYQTKFDGSPYGYHNTLFHSLTGNTRYPLPVSRFVA